MQALETELDAWQRDLFAKEHDRRLQHTATASAGWYLKAGEIRAFQISIPIRRYRCRMLHPNRIQPDQFRLQRLTATDRSAIQTFDAVQSSMQIADTLAAGSLVQAVDILGDEPVDMLLLLQACQGGMRSVGHDGRHHWPAQQAARPVALASMRASNELLKVHGRLALPLSALVSIGRNARVDAATGAGQDEQALAAGDEFDQLIELFCSLHKIRVY